MKQTYQHTIRLLTRPERARFYLLLFLELLVTLLDLAFLALLFLVVGHYTNTLPDGTLPTWMETFIAIHPLALAGSFLLLFALKNLLGYRVFRSQYRFIYQVATRLSERILTGWLSTPYADHVNIDSSVLIRRVSQQPVEFGHHVLRGFQQVISNSILVALTVIAIIIFDAYLFGMLLLMLLPAIMALALFSRQRLLNIRRTIRADREKTQQYLRESLDGYVEANLYQRKDFFIKRYARYQEKYNAGLAST